MKNFSKFVLMCSCLFTPLMCLADVVIGNPMHYPSVRIFCYLLTCGILSLCVLLIISVNQRCKKTENAEKKSKPLKKALKIALNVLLGGFAFLSLGLLAMLSIDSTILEFLILILPAICIILSSVIIHIAVKKRNLPNKLLLWVPVAGYLITTSVAGWAYVHYYEIEDYLLSKQCDKCKTIYRGKHSCLYCKNHNKYFAEYHFCWYCKNHNEYFDGYHECFYCSYHSDWHIQYRKRQGREYEDEDGVVYWKTSDACKAICKVCDNDYTHLIHNRKKKIGHIDIITRAASTSCHKCGRLKNLVENYDDDDEQK